MPFLERFFNSIENPAVPISSPEVLKVIGSSMTADTGVEVSESAALGHTPIWRGVNMLSSDVAKVPKHVLRRTANNGKERFREHPAYRLLRHRPNGWMTAFQRDKTLVLHALLRGNGYNLIRRAGGRPVELWPLPPMPATFPVLVSDGRGGKRKWIISTIDGEQFRFPDEDVIHLAGLSWDGLEGMDVLSVMLHAFGLPITTHRRAERWMARGAHTFGFFTAPRRLSPEEKQDLKDNWNKMRTDAAEVGGAGVLGGDVKFQELSLDPEKLQLLASREFDIIEVANVLNMPPHKLGHTARTSFNSLEQENADYLSTTLDPWLVALEEEHREKLLTEEEKRSEEVLIEAERKAILRVDFVNRVMGMAKLREVGIMDGNQVAAAENLPSFEGGERRYVPSNWMELGSAVSGTTGMAGALAAQRQVLTHEASHLVGYEVRSACQAAGRERNFLAWADSFYATFVQKLCAALEPAAEAWMAVAGRTGAGFAVLVAVQRYCEASRRALFDLAGANKSEEFAAAVEAATARWVEERVAELVNSITE